MPSLTHPKLQYPKIMPVGGNYIKKGLRIGEMEMMYINN